MILSKVKNYALIGLGAFLVLILSFMGGCQYHKRTYKCPIALRDTIVVYDTVIHTIQGVPPGYIVIHDSVLVRDTVFKDIDTMAILLKYYSINYFTQLFNDSLISAKNEIAVMENQIIDNNFSYRILRPQTIINNSVDNSIHYNKYIYFGLDIPIKNINYINLEALYAFPKGYTGVGYSPNLKSISIKAGVRLFQFK